MSDSLSRAQIPAAARKARRAAIFAVAVLGAAVGATYFAMPAGAAETLTIKGDKDAQAWFWSSNKDFRQCSPILPPPAPPDSYCDTRDLSGTPANTISPGHLPVSLKNGSSDMRSYLAFDLSEIPDGATVSSARLELTVARATGSADHTTEHGQPGAKPPATANESAARIKACLVIVPWGSSEGAPPETMDPHDPTKASPAEPTLLDGVSCNVSSLGETGTTWKFDMKPFIQKWLAGEPNNGIILMPQQTGPVDTWTLEFHGGEFKRRTEDPSGAGGTQEVTYVTAAEASKLAITYTAPPPIPELTLESPPTPPIDTGGQPPPPPVVDVSPEPTSSPTPTVSVPVARSEPRTPWYSWLLFPALLLGLVAVSRSIGREISTAGGNRVATMLRSKKNESLGE